MGKTQQTAVQLDPELLEVARYEIACLDEAIEAHRGTQAEKIREAMELALGADYTFEMDEAMDTNEDGMIWPPVSTVTVGYRIEWLTTQLAAAEQVQTELANLHLAKTGGNSREALDVLKVKRADLVTAYDSFANVLKAMGWEDEIPELPPAPRTGGGRPAGSKNGSGKVTEKSFRLVVRIPGKAEYSPADGNFATLAFHKGEILTGVKGAKTAALKSAIAEKLNRKDVVFGEDWTVELPGGTVQCIVTEKDTPDTDEEGE